MSGLPKHRPPLYGDERTSVVAIFKNLVKVSESFSISLIPDWMIFLGLMVGYPCDTRKVLTKVIFRSSVNRLLKKFRLEA